MQYLQYVCQVMSMCHAMHSVGPWFFCRDKQKMRSKTAARLRRRSVRVPPEGEGWLTPQRFICLADEIPMKLSKNWSTRAHVKDRETILWGFVCVMNVDCILLQ